MHTMTNLINNEDVYITRHAIERFSKRVLGMSSIMPSQYREIKAIIYQQLPNKIIYGDRIAYKINGILYILNKHKLVTVIKNNKKEVNGKANKRHK